MMETASLTGYDLAEHPVNSHDLPTKYRVPG